MQFAKYVACGISLLAMACQPAADHSPGGEELYQLCANCHGDTATGSCHAAGARGTLTAKAVIYPLAGHRSRGTALRNNQRA